MLVYQLWTALVIVAVVASALAGLFVSGARALDPRSRITDGLRFLARSITTGGAALMLVSGMCMVQTGTRPAPPAAPGHTAPVPSLLELGTLLLAAVGYGVLTVIAMALVCYPLIWLATGRARRRQTNRAAQSRRSQNGYIRASAHVCSDPQHADSTEPRNHQR